MKTIKIIEDDLLLKDALKKYFEQRHYKVSDNIDKTHDLDIYIVDYDLSKDPMYKGENGLDILKKLKEKNEDIIGIITTIFTDNELREKSFLSHADYFISKPFDMKKLEHIIDILYKEKKKYLIKKQKMLTNRIRNIETMLFQQLKDYVNNKLTVIALALDILDSKNEEIKQLVEKDISDISKEIEKLEQSINEIINQRRIV